MPKKSAKSDFTVYEVMPGAKLISYGGINILIGIPAEVVKVLIRKKLPIPTHLVLPDDNYIENIPQNSTEFPLYYFLFGFQGLAKGMQLSLIGTEKQLKYNFELLRITLLGLNKEQFDMLEIDENIKEMLLKEQEFYKLKGKNNKSLELEDLVQRNPFNDKNETKIEDLSIRKSGKNKFELEDDYGNKLLVDINTKKEQKPPYDIPIDINPKDFVKFGVEVIGSSSGFSPIKPCSGLVISYNSSYILIDAIPYLDYLLKARGISKNQIKVCFITHIHDDHCVLLPFLFSSKKVKIITTPEIYYMALYKLALTLHIDDYREMDRYFDFIPAYPGEEINYYGMKILPHYTIHSIPTIGAKFSVKEGNKTYSFTYVGDNQSYSIIDGMYDKGLISSERKKNIKSLYTEEVDLLIADGGQGMIHGDIEDAMESESKKIAFIHLDEIPPEYSTTFNLAAVGKIYTLIDGQEAERVTKTIEYLNNIFPEEMESNWTPYLMQYNKLNKYNSGDIIIKQGAEYPVKTYLILSGYCKVLMRRESKTEYITTLEAGDIVGEIAVINNSEYRTATVIAETPVTLCEFNADAFKEFSMEKELLFKLNSLWSLRWEFSKIPFLKKFPHRVVTEMARISTEIIYGDMQKIPIDEDNNKVYIILEGSALIIHKD
ncbi:MAG: cyclic nucleotide-binding domain-containing protein, partial [Spirochaetota bacterium]